MDQGIRFKFQYGSYSGIPVGRQPYSTAIFWKSNYQQRTAKCFKLYAASENSMIINTEESVLDTILNSDLPDRLADLNNSKVHFQRFPNPENALIYANELYLARDYNSLQALIDSDYMNSIKEENKLEDYIQDTKQKIRSRREENADGAFDIQQMRREAKLNFELNHADYYGQFQIQYINDDVGRGLFATKDINKGDIILAEKALAYVELKDGSEKSLFIVDSSVSPKMHAQQLLQAAYKMVLSMLFKESSNDPQRRSKLYFIHPGNNRVHGYGTFQNAVSFEDHFDGAIVKEDPGPSLGSMDAAQQEKFAGLVAGVIMQNACAERKAGKGSSVGLWLIESIINSSEAPNVDIAHIGDFHIVTAAEDIKAGTQITRCLTHKSPAKLRDIIGAKKRTKVKQSFGFAQKEGDWKQAIEEIKNMDEQQMKKVVQAAKEEVASIYGQDDSEDEVVDDKVGDKK